MVGEKNEQVDSKGTQCKKETILHMLPMNSSVLQAYCTSIRGQLGENNCPGQIAGQRSHRECPIQRLDQVNEKMDGTLGQLNCKADNQQSKTDNVMETGS